MPRSPASGRAKPHPVSAVEKPTPAQVRKSVIHEAPISFEHGRPYKTLRRHLTSKGITPEAYHAKWGLPSDYPMTAAGYSEMRLALASSLGLGLGQPRRQPQEAEPAPPPATIPEGVPRRRGPTAKAPTLRG